MVGGFATAYDLVASEYGWTDQQIGATSLVRLRQIISAIQLRRWEADRKENARVSWLARITASYIAGGYQIEKNKPNQALEDAKYLGFDEIDRAGAGKADTQAGENRAGSFEYLQGWGQQGMLKRT